MATELFFNNVLFLNISNAQRRESFHVDCKSLSAALSHPFSPFLSPPTVGLVFGCILNSTAICIVSASLSTFC